MTSHSPAVFFFFKYKSCTVHYNVFNAHSVLITLSFSLSCNSIKSRESVQTSRANLQVSKKIHLSNALNHSRGLHTERAPTLSFDLRLKKNVTSSVCVHIGIPSVVLPSQSNAKIKVYWPAFWNGLRQRFILLSRRKHSMNMKYRHGHHGWMSRRRLLSIIVLHYPTLLIR